MSGKAGPSHPTDAQPPAHGPALVEAVTTALSWLTVLPVRGATVFDRTTGARAMMGMPVVGAALGALAAGVVACGQLLLLPPVAIGALVVVALELSTRMMHLDGLADVGDALGSYAPPERAREILADRYTGALGVGAVVLTLLTQWAAFAGLAGLEGPVGVWACAAAPLLARVVALLGCTPAFHPQSATGFGALVIGTVAPAAWWGWLLALSAVLTGAAWRFASLAGVGLVVCFLIVLVVAARAVFAHMQRRFGGLNGDCLGAVIEGSTAAAAMLALIAFAV